MPTFIATARVDRAPQAQGLQWTWYKMRGTRWTLALIVTLSTLAFTPAPANADFHGVCTGFATGFADVDLELGESQDPYEQDPFVFSGFVSCPDAVITITSLQLYDVGGEEPVLIAETDGEPCAAALDGPCTLEEEAAAGTGSFEVRMRFDADDPQTPHTDYQDVPRRAVFQYNGYGEPVPTCTSIGTFPVYLPPGC